MGLTDLFDISLARANQLYTWGWRFSVFGAVITMLSIAALWLGTRVRDHDFESKISETTLSAEQLHKDNLTLQTNLEKERFARLQLEGRTEKFGLEIAKANQAAEEAKARGLAAGKDVAKLQTEAADAKARQAEAELKLARVTKRQEPRSINVEFVASSLRTAPPAKAILLYPQGLPESLNFASMVRQALNKGGWKVVEYKAVPETTTWGYSTHGAMTFMARDLDPPSASLIALILGFQETELDFDGHNDPELPGDTIRLVIFPKP